MRVEWRTRRWWRSTCNRASISTAFPRWLGTWFLSRSARPLARGAKHFDEAFLEIQIDHLTHCRADGIEVAVHPRRPAAHQPLFDGAGAVARQQLEGRARQVLGSLRDAKTLHAVAELVHR